MRRTRSTGRQDERESPRPWPRRHAAERLRGKRSEPQSEDQPVTTGFQGQSHREAAATGRRAKETGRAGRRAARRDLPAASGRTHERRRSMSAGAINFQTAKRVPIARVLAHYGVQLHATGGELRGQCPLPEHIRARAATAFRSTQPAISGVASLNRASMRGTENSAEPCLTWWPGWSAVRSGRPQRG